MAVRIRYVTDPGCSWSWAVEPSVRRLEREFEGQVSFTYVMGGLARDYLGRQPTLPEGVDPPIYTWLLQHWLDVAAETAAPLDPMIWARSPIRSTYPACMAVKAAAEQSDDAGGAYLRRVREGLLCGRRRLDSADVLTEEALTAGLDARRFAADLESSAVIEAFGADLQEARDLAASVPDGDRDKGIVTRSDGSERVSFPSLVFEGEDGVPHGVWGARPYEDYRAAALAAGAVASDDAPPGVEDALRRFGRMTGPEVAAVCELPGPRAQAELWRLAGEWRIRPTAVTTGHLWDLAAG